ncbi:MAG: preprotein translocase subunit SecG [Bacteroidales bacterium]|nr:preprotein translocase subunit SecG [Bacteroidales bacterium]
MAGFVTIGVLIVIVCVLLTLIVLVQSSKGGGLASSFSSSNQFMGVRKTADFLEKATWTLAIALLVLSLFSIFVIPRGSSSQLDTELREQIENTPDILPVEDYIPPPGQDEIPEEQEPVE